MARVVLTIDDISGEEGAEQRQFMIGGEVTTIDLTDEGYDELIDTLKPWLEAGRKTARLNAAGDQLKPYSSPAPSNPSRTPKEGESHVRHTEEERKAMFEWCQENNIYRRSGGGRVRARIWHAYRTNDMSGLKAEDFIEGKAPKQLQLAETA